MSLPVIVNSYAMNIFRHVSHLTGMRYKDAMFYANETEAFAALKEHLEDDLPGDYQHTVIVVERMYDVSAVTLKDLRAEAAAEIVQDRADRRAMAHAGPGEAP